MKRDMDLGREVLMKITDAEKPMALPKLPIQR